MKNFSLFEKEERIECKPFIKWVGGKGQLLPEISKLYPIELGKTINKYAEIFIGGGAVLFDILSKYKLDEVYISDKNLELINTYKTIRDNVDILIKSLKEMEEKYVPMNNEDRKVYYYERRSEYNNLKINIEENNIRKAALFMFLNKTCFNGLYRVNKKGEYNVPMGAYKNPKICDEENLKNVSLALKNVKIIYADYRESKDFIDNKTFVYIDPPYRPLNITSSFTSYTENDFSDKEQIELAEYIDVLNKKGAKIVISNSDPKNIEPENNFFDKLYKKEKFGNVHLDKINGDFEFRNVDFSYGKTKVLKNLSFKIAANSTVAFVGKSGSGKTTIFNLLAKMYDVDSGQILIDNHDIKTLDKDTIRGNITIISQNPYIFNMSIKENLLLVKNDLTDEEMKEACKLACLDKFIENLENQYDTVIGEGGVNLSGGQKQRLAIARALIQKTEIILFDEATSALDNETQYEIQKAIENMEGEYTILIIAHRLSTRKKANKIFYLENGKIIDSGNHEYLINNCESYKHLYETEISKD